MKDCKRKAINKGYKVLEHKGKGCKSLKVKYRKRKDKC